MFAGNTSELEQFSLYNYHRQNPAYISPNVDWPDITTWVIMATYFIQCKLFDYWILQEWSH